MDMQKQVKTRIEKTVLSNGLTVISEYVPAVHSVSLGVWVKTGTRYENEKNNGIAHFLEHMVFKGTKRRSAFKIVQSIEELGGSLNAYTSKELTVYYAHALDTQLTNCVNVLSDMLCHSLFRQRDIDHEKQVILEEIGSVKDTPDEYIFDLFQENLFPKQPIGFPILGTEQSVTQLSRDDLIEFWSKYYCSDNIVIAAAGNLRHDRFVKLVEKRFHFLPRALVVNFESPLAAKNIDLEFSEPVNQAHLCVGLEALSYLSQDRYVLMAINSYLGGGMSSKLFQVIREKYGLAYSVFSFVDFFRDTGMLSFYIGTDKCNQKRALGLLFTEIEKLTQKELRKSRVDKIKEQMKGNILLALESSNRRMTRLARNEIYYNRQIDLDELVEQINAITPESLHTFSRNIFKFDHFNVVKLIPNN